MSSLNPANYTKALYAAFVAAQTLFVAAIAPMSERSVSVSTNEWVLLVFGAFIAGLGTYVLPNAGTKPAE